METLAKQEGLITKIIGPVVDVEFQQGYIFKEKMVRLLLQKFNKC
jgi:F0F1-type ATP synthase beta subunit